MTDAILPFSAAEYDLRLAKTRAAMQDRGLDLLIVTDPANQHWLTGYDGWSFYVHQAVILALAGPPLWWGRNQDANGARRTVDPARTQIAGYADHYVQSTTRHPMQDLAQRLPDLLTAKTNQHTNQHTSDQLADTLGPNRSGLRIGVEMENYYYSAKAHATLSHALAHTLAETSLPNPTLVDATGLVNWQRAVKSPAEQDFMRRAARITNKIQNFALDRAEPGLRKNELAAQIMAQGITGVGADWGDYPSIVPLMPSGSDAAAPHLTWDGRPLQKGEATFFELAGVFRRYHVPCSRTVFLGSPPDHIRRAEAALIAGLNAGLDQARAGNRAADIANALGAQMDKAGIERGARCGYAIGLSYPPDWGERTISLRPEDDTTLEPGMCFHFMPGIWQDDWGIEITEPILIQESGPAECFCDLPRALVVKP